MLDRETSGRRRREHYGLDRDLSGSRRRSLVTCAVLCFAAEGCSEERGAAGAEQGGVRLRVRADGAGDRLRGGGREGIEGASRSRRAAGGGAPPREEGGPGRGGGGGGGGGRRRKGEG